MSINALPILLLGAVALLVCAIMGAVPWAAPIAVGAIWLVLSVILAAERKQPANRRRR